MKLLVLLSYTLAAAQASWPSPVKYHGPQHIPVIHNGVPVETPEVQHAKAAHFAAFAAASVAHSNSAYEQGEHNNINFGYQHEDNIAIGNNIHQNDYIYTIQHESQPTLHHHITSHHLDQYQQHPIIGPKDHLLEVETAKTEHLAAVNDALSHYRKRRSASPLDHETEVHTFDVRNENHHLSYEDADAHNYQIGYNQHQLSNEDQHHLLNKIDDAYYHQSYESGNIHPPHSYEVSNVQSYYRPQFYQISNADHDQSYKMYKDHPSYQITHDYHQAALDNNDHQNTQYTDQHIAPVDTQEIQKAGAHAEAKSISHGYSSHQIHAPVYHQPHSHKIPSISHDGTPVDTAEVAHAKALHFAAHQQAALRNSHHRFSKYQNEGPVDTHEVQQAKIQHFAAHAAAKGHHH